MSGWSGPRWQNSWQITPVHGSAREQALARVLQAFMGAYDLTRWSWARDVRPDHDLPVAAQTTKEGEQYVLRLSAAGVKLPTPESVTLADWTPLLGTFLLGQLRAYLDIQSLQTPQAVAELQTVYPEVPVGEPEGAGTALDTYRHLILCTLEVDSVAFVLGEETAQTFYAHPAHFRFIYRTVLRDRAALQDLIRRQDLDFPFLRRPR